MENYIELSPLIEYNITIDSVMFIGDAHLNSSSPRSRVDNYADTSIKKLEALRLIANDRNIPIIIFTGDFFHLPQQPITYLSRVIGELLKFKQNNIELFTIVGN